MPYQHFFGDACDDLCSCFITLTNNSPEKQCNNMLHALESNYDVITEFKKTFQLINAVLKHTTKTTSKVPVDLGFVKEAKISCSRLT